MVGSIIMISSVWLRDHHRLVMNAIIIIKVTVQRAQKQPHSLCVGSRRGVGGKRRGEEEEGVKEVERKKADHRRPCAVPLY